MWSANASFLILHCLSHPEYHLSVNYFREGQFYGEEFLLHTGKIPPLFSICGLYASLSSPCQVLSEVFDLFSLPYLGVRKIN